MKRGGEAKKGRGRRSADPSREHPPEQPKPQPALADRSEENLVVVVIVVVAVVVVAFTLIDASPSIRPASTTTSGAPTTPRIVIYQSKHRTRARFHARANRDPNERIAHLANTHARARARARSSRDRTDPVGARNLRRPAWSVVRARGRHTSVNGVFLYASRSSGER